MSSPGYYIVITKTFTLIRPVSRAFHCLNGLFARPFVGTGEDLATSI
jgi:hypothetical protein